MPFKYLFKFCESVNDLEQYLRIRVPSSSLTGMYQSHLPSFAYIRTRFNKLTRRQKLILGGSIAGVSFLVVLLSAIFHTRIINWAKPLAEKYTRRPGGFLVPSILLMLVSIPPLFGHELISFLTGFVYGNSGFIIVVISTTIGESLLFLSFRHLFTSKIAAFREQYKDYDIFVRVIEEGGQYMILAIRCSAIPSHFSTPLFASIEAIEYKTWLICCLVSSFSLYPPVYFGWLLKRGESSSITPWLLTFGFGITLLVGLYIWMQYKHHKAVQSAKRADLEASLVPAVEEEEDIFNLVAEGTSGDSQGTNPDVFFDKSVKFRSP